jgi:hypothetical protein
MADEIIYQTNDLAKAQEIAAASQGFTGRQTTVENSAGVFLVKEKRD